jgi:hypothetical protein
MVEKDLSFDELVLFLPFHVTDVFFIPLFFQQARLISNFHMPFFWIVTGAKRSIG